MKPKNTRHQAKNSDSLYYIETIHDPTRVENQELFTWEDACGIAEHYNHSYPGGIIRIMEFEPI